MYFPHAFKKVFAPILQANLLKVTADFIDTIFPGQLAFVSPKTWNSVIPTDADVTKHPMLLLVQGSTHNVDKIGSHGGYKESIKSKGINPRFVSRFIKIVGKTAQNQKLQVGWNGVSDLTAPTFHVGELYQLRVDVKGESVLSFLQRNLYDVFDAKSGCVNDCADPCAAPDKVDPAVILLQWADGINQDPIYKFFVKASVRVKSAAVAGYDEVTSDTYIPKTSQVDIAAVIAGLHLEVAYVDTKFSNCTFELRDSYTLQPVTVGVSLVDDSGDPCKQQTIAVNEVQAPRIATGTGETVLRQLVLSNMYSQEYYTEDKRKNEIEDLNSTTVDRVSRPGTYDTYLILHSVPRMNNATSLFDSDQYLLQLNVPTGTDMSAFVNFFEAYLASAKTGVKLETL